MLGVMVRKPGCGVLLVGLVAVLLAGCGGGSGSFVPTTQGTGPTLSNDPTLMSEAGLKAEARFLGQPVYWAGPRKGVEYEFRRTSVGNVYVRYLPEGAPAGDAGTFLTIATYPFPGAVKAVKTVGKGSVVAGPGGSVVYARPVASDNSDSVLMAFRRVPYEIEVYAPRARVAITVAQSGRVRPIG